MSPPIILAPGHHGSPRNPYPIFLFELAERTADEVLSFIVANGVEQLFIESLVTARDGTAQVVPEMRVIYPSGAGVSVGSPLAMNAVGSLVTSWGAGAETAFDKRVDRLLVADMEYALTMNHADAQAITYSVAAWVF